MTPPRSPDGIKMGISEDEATNVGKWQAGHLFIASSCYSAAQGKILTWAVNWAIF